MGRSISIWSKYPVFYGIKQLGDYFYIPANKNFVLAPKQLRTFYTKFYVDHDLYPIANWVHKSVSISLFPIKARQLIRCQLHNLSDKPIQLSFGVCLLCFYCPGGVLTKQSSMDVCDVTNNDWQLIWDELKAKFPFAFAENNRAPSCDVEGLEFWRSIFDFIPKKPMPLPSNIYPKVDKVKIDSFLESELRSGQLESVSLDNVKYLILVNFRIKPNGQLRPVYDFRKLNSFLIPTSKAPIDLATPNLMGGIYALPKFRFALSIDLKSAYHNVKMPLWIRPYFLHCT